MAKCPSPLQATSVGAEANGQNAGVDRGSTKKARDLQEKGSSMNGIVNLGDLVWSKKAKKSKSTPSTGEEEVVNRAAERTAAAVGESERLSPFGSPDQEAMPMLHSLHEYCELAVMTSLTLLLGCCLAIKTNQRQLYTD